MESRGPKLLDRVRDAIRTRHYSRRTEAAYVTWIRRYIVFHHKVHPATLGAADISAFLTWLATTRRVSASTQNQALAALLFLYEHVLHMSLGPVEHVVRAKRPVRLPVVLSRDEVGLVLARLDGSMWVIGMLHRNHSEDSAASFGRSWRARTIERCPAESWRRSGLGSVIIST